MPAPEPVVVTVFADGPGGGNPAPVVLDARGWSDTDMQRVARETGHESAFVVDAEGTGCDVALRFWVPRHEMSMCGHATLGAVWLLHQRGLLPGSRELRVHTASGVVRARVADDGAVTISQPLGTVEAVADDAEVLAALGVRRADVAGPVRNATTSRTKTLVELADPERLDTLAPAPDEVERACSTVDSTGLYPHARTGARRFDARQFPRASGYPEDPATGIAAAALVSGLVDAGTVDPTAGPVVVRQGRAMGRPSRITVTVDRDDPAGPVLWLGGPVQLG